MVLLTLVVLLNLMRIMSQSYHPLPQREHLQTYLVLIQMMLLLPMVMLQLRTPTILMNLILNIYAKASKSENANLVISLGPTNSPVPLDLSRFQFVLYHSPTRDQRAHNTTIFRIRFAILF